MLSAAYGAESGHTTEIIGCTIAGQIRPMAEEGSIGMGSFKARVALGLAGAAACALMAAASGGASAAPVAQPGYQRVPGLRPSQDFSGIWQADTYEARLTPVWGGEPPFTKAGRAAFRANNRDIKKKDDGKALCLQQGTPRYFVSPYPFMVLMTPKRVTIVHEENRSYRHLYVNAGHNDPDIWDPSFAGDAVSKWNGDVLEVDVVNFNGKTWLDDAGLPSSEQLHVTERWRKLEDGRLEVVATVTDPINYSQSWMTRRVFQPRPDVELHDDYVCGEPHRSLADVKGAEKMVEVPAIQLMFAEDKK